jgi:hypothetical protein
MIRILTVTALAALLLSAPAFAQTTESVDAVVDETATAAITPIQESQSAIPLVEDFALVAWSPLTDNIEVANPTYEPWAIAHPFKLMVFDFPMDQVAAAVTVSAAGVILSSAETYAMADDSAYPGLIHHPQVILDNVPAVPTNAYTIEVRDLTGAIVYQSLPLALMTMDPY